jgi:hypothetical protein
MAFQKKFSGPFDQHAPEFWGDLPRAISFMIRDLLFGRNIARVAQLLGKTDSLLYKWADPSQEALPNALQLFQLITITENCQPVVSAAQACGYDLVPRGLTDLEAMDCLVKIRKEARP